MVLVADSDHGTSEIHGCRDQRGATISSEASSRSVCRTVQLVEQHSKEDGGALAIVLQGREVLRELNAADGPVTVVCIAGLYRSGKSLLLNHLARWLGFSGDLTVGNNTDSCTRGIWATILLGGNGLLQKYVPGPLMLLDTEGLASEDQDETYDCKIFTLGLLLSSTFVYNSLGVIDESAVDKLCMVSKLAQKVSKSNKIRFSLLWVLRDFGLGLERFRNDANVYLEDALMDKNKPSANDKKEISNCAEIKKIFSTRLCRAIARPVAEERDLQWLDTLNCEKLRPEFIQQTEELFQLILDRSAPKKLSGQPLDGASLVAFLETCLHSIDDGAVPDIKETFMYVAEENFRRVRNQAETLYATRMNLGSAKPYQMGSWQQLARRHEVAREEAVALFSAPNVFDTAGKAAFIEGLNIKLQGELDQKVWPAVAAQSIASSDTRWAAVLSKIDKVLGEQGERDFVHAFSLVLHSIEVDDDESQAAVELGPERNKVFRQALVRDVALARLIPRLAREAERTQDLQTRCEKTEASLAKAEAALAAAQEELSVTKEKLGQAEVENVRQSGQLAAFKQQTEALTVQVGQQLASHQTEKVAHDAIRSRLDESLAAAARETGVSAALEQRDAENKLLRDELDDIIAAAAQQQADFDVNLAEASAAISALQAEIVLEGMLHSIECTAITKDKLRVDEERAVLHEQLQNFHNKASTLPTWMQEYF